MGRWQVKVGVVMAVLAVSVVAAAGASAKAVPCTKLSFGKYECSFYPPGNGISAGAPVRNAAGKLVGYLNQGRNWIVCQASGATVHYHGYYNRWWGYTEANDHHTGWVNAVYASGGSNNGPFAAIVPNCGSTYGSPPTSATPPTSTPTPIPTPTPTPTPREVPCQSIGRGKHQCFFYPPGDGIHNGTPVFAGSKRVGYLNYGYNWVLCQQRGAPERIGNGVVNVWWAWTEANDRNMGWVNAVYARGGSNNGRFGGVPSCRRTHGTPPGGTRRKPKPPAPKPKPKPPKKEDRCLDLRRNQGITVIYTTRREHYKVTQSGGGPPSYQNIENPRTTPYGRVHLNATTCKKSRGHWVFVQRANVSRSTYGIYKDASNHVAPRGSNDAAGWGVTIAGAQHHTIDVLSVACSSQSSFFGDAASFMTSIPYPKANFYWALGELGLNKVVEYFGPKPSVRCLNLGTDLVRLSIDRQGGLHARVVPDGAAGGDSQIVHRFNLSGDGSIQEVIVQQQNYRIRLG